MGWFSGFLKKRRTNNLLAEMMNGYTPIFSQFGQDIYASDVVQQAVNCIVQECQKLIPKHVRVEGSDIIPVNDDLQQLLKEPNSLMTTTDFIEKVVWLLMLNYNSWIIPTYAVWRDDKGREKKRYTGLYPVMPTSVEWQQDGNNDLYVKLGFLNGYETVLPYSDVIHIRYRYSVNELMGGNEFGQPDNSSLLKTLQINNDLLEGVSKAAKKSLAVTGVVKFNTYMDDGKTETAMRDLEKKLNQNMSGFLPLDLKSEYIPINPNIKFVDAETLKFIDEKILRNFGVPLPILTGDYTKAQYEAFFQKTIEPLVLRMNGAFTKTLFTDGQKTRGNEIRFYTKHLEFMTTDQVIEMLRLLGDAGDLYENEKRTAVGYEPLPELVGVRMQSLNYVDANKAWLYQKKKIGGQDGEQK